MSKLLEKILGEYVCNQQGEKVPVHSLCGKDRILGLYFSAHWCPPCRVFTPKLVEFYKKQKESGTGLKLEIVFVSWDRDEASYKEYFEQMPWLALPYDLDKKGKLCKKFRVQGIPKLMILDGETGKTITSEGYSCLCDDENGLEFPWRPKHFSDVIKGKLLKESKEVDAAEELKGKIVGVYFSAHWCPPCRAFTPQLMETYTKLTCDGRKFEVVFVTSDRSQESFDQYCSTMPWLSVPFDDSRLEELKKLFGVDGIPMMVVLDETGSVITMAGRLAVMEDREGQDFPWYPKPVIELTEGAAVQLNESACLVLFIGECEDEDIDKARDLLMDSAKEELAKGEDQELFFFLAIDDDICDSVRQFASLEDRVPLLVILDFPEQRVFINEATEVTKDVIKDFVKGYFNETLQPRPLRGEK
ncbi:hypothetical protein ACJMK2_011529 [Sinanodonta woodiana]|uniref:Thioredoxin domain-containing protein n=1 Tax=Sinanodonta woodiana TaxID=1069815 RepID=A0ABD3V5C0_SINWO